jgi:hypothetical protein
VDTIRASTSTAPVRDGAFECASTSIGCNGSNRTLIVCASTSIERAGDGAFECTSTSIWYDGVNCVRMVVKTGANGVFESSASTSIETACDGTIVCASRMSDFKGPKTGANGKNDSNGTFEPCASTSIGCDGSNCTLFADCTGDFKGVGAVFAGRTYADAIRATSTTTGNGKKNDCVPACDGAFECASTSTAIDGANRAYAVDFKGVGVVFTGQTYMDAVPATSTSTGNGANDCASTSIAIDGTNHALFTGYFKGVGNVFAVCDLNGANHLNGALKCASTSIGYDGANDSNGANDFSNGALECASTSIGYDRSNRAVGALFTSRTGSFKLACDGANGAIVHASTSIASVNGTCASTSIGYDSSNVQVPLLDAMAWIVPMEPSLRGVWPISRELELSLQARLAMARLYVQAPPLQMMAPTIARPRLATLQSYV